MIYLDMDGVLADFVQHTINLGIPNNKQWYEPREKWTEETWAGEKIKTDAMHSRGFWNSLPVCPGAQALWDFCSEYDRGVLTAKPQPDSPWLVHYEKLQWLDDFLGLVPSDKFVCCHRSEKWNHAISEGGLVNILVDDDTRNCKEWEKAGGIAILHGDSHTRKNGGISEKHVIKTIERLKEIVNA